ncbi:kinesin-like protein KIF12 [Erpetoichthys calabaricus]|nr:kinesin-like protein KIF12 [Erpetoichthys calabaricus]
MFHSLLSKSEESKDVKNQSGDGQSNIIAAVRVRPLSCEELHREDREVLYSPIPGTLQVNHGSQDKLFTFDAVFKPKCSQHEVFEKCGVKRLLDLVFQGFSCTVFAFGQTGSGKTYTLCGPYSLFHGGLKDHSFCGLTQRSFEYILERTQSTQEEFVLSATFLEIYNEQVRDLLNPSGSLNVRWNKEKGFYVQNLTRVNFELLGTVMDLLERGMLNRQTSGHSLNEHSSRSHSIFTIHVENKAQDNALGSVGKQGKFCIVDLAGSERVKETGSFGELLEEACSINRSLLTLGNCISALVDTRKKERHIPYRDSKLTKLLADSLGGSGLTLMIACVSPAAACLQETLNVLRYANRAKTIKNRPIAKLDSKQRQTAHYDYQIKVLKAENQKLREKLQLLSVNSKQSAGKNTERESGENESLNQSIKNSPSIPNHSLYGLLQEFMLENCALRQEKSTLLRDNDTCRQEIQRLWNENKCLILKVEDMKRLVCSTTLDSGRQSRKESSNCGWVKGLHPPCCLLPSRHVTDLTTSEYCFHDSHLKNSPDSSVSFLPQPPPMTKQIMESSSNHKKSCKHGKYDGKCNDYVSISPISTPERSKQCPKWFNFTSPHHQSFTLRPEDKVEPSAPPLSTISSFELDTIIFPPLT